MPPPCSHNFNGNGLLFSIFLMVILLFLKPLSLKSNKFFFPNKIYYAFMGVRNPSSIITLIVALSVSIFSLYSIKQKQKICGFHQIFSRIFKILQKWKLVSKNIFKILIIHKPSLGSREVPQKIWARSV